MLIISQSKVDSVIDIIKKGGLVVFPTETVFGIGCVASKEESYEALCKAKNRHPDKPITLMCSKIEQVEKYVVIDDVAKKIIEKFFPGQLTLILKAKKDVPHYIDLGTGYVGIRIPDSKFVIDMINKVGEAMLVTSANISDFPPATNDKEALNYFKDNVDVIIKGESVSNVPSSVIKLDHGKLIVLREGLIKKEELEEVIHG